MKNRTITKVLVLASILLLCFFKPFASEKVTINQNGIQVSVVSSSSTKTELKILVGEFYKTPVTINGKTYYSIDLLKEAAIEEKGNPDLGKISRSIMIPETGLMKISITGSSYVDYNMEVAPSKGVLSRTIDPSTIAYTFADTYSKNSFYPTTIASLGSPYILRDLRGMAVSIVPFQYNPITKKLRVYTSISVTITNSGTDTKNIITRPSDSTTDQFNGIYKAQFLNYQASRFTAISESGRMIVITPDEYATQVQPLVDWKNSSGVPTTVTKLSSIGSTNTQIMTYIQNEYNKKNGLSYVLLIGDASKLPTFTYSGGGSDPSYALLAGNDNYPDIFVGRLSAENTTDVTTQVNKTIYYEKNMTTTGWFNNGLGIGSDQGPGDNSEYDYQHIRNIRTKLLGYHYTSVAELYDGSQGGLDAAGNPTAANVASVVNSGVSIINYTGHGSNTSWGTTGFAVGNVNALTNDNKLPIIFSVACVNGNFVGTTCFAEAWLRAKNASTGNPTGAAAMYASSINQDWNSPMYCQDAFNNLLVAESNTSMGGLCFTASCKMMDAYGSSGVNMFKTWHIFGDPSLKVINKSCKSSVTITSNITGGTASTTASASIVASNKISSNATVHYGANSSVRMITGFAVSSGSKFLADLKGCRGSSFKDDLVEDETSIAAENTTIDDSRNELTKDIEIDKNDVLSISPNPTTSSFEINHISAISSITIYSMSGSVVYNANNVLGKTNITLPNKGVYIVTIVSDSATVSKKVIVD